MRAESSRFATRGYPRVSIWQGTADSVVLPASADDLLAQWCNVHEIESTPSSVETPSATVTHVRFADVDGAVQVESWTIQGMEHGTAIDPTHGCGTDGPYMLDVGVCSTTKAAEFFGLL